MPSATTSSQPAYPDSPRLLLLAAPPVGRGLERVLRDAGYTVFRSPDGDYLATLVTRLQPQALIIVLPLPWVETDLVAEAHRLTDSALPLLVLDASVAQAAGSGVPGMAQERRAHLLAAVAQMLSASEGTTRGL